MSPALAWAQSAHLLPAPRFSENMLNPRHPAPSGMSEAQNIVRCHKKQQIINRKVRNPCSVQKRHPVHSGCRLLYNAIMLYVTTARLIHCDVDKSHKKPRAVSPRRNSKKKRTVPYNSIYHFNNSPVCFLFLCNSSRVEKIRRFTAASNNATGKRRTPLIVGFRTLSVIKKPNLLGIP